jgi:hypothetical protein
MRRVFLAASLLLAFIASASAQSTGPSVTVKGPVTPGNCTIFFSATTIQDAGGLCGGAANPAGSVGNVQFNNTAFGADSTFTFNNTTKALSFSQGVVGTATGGAQGVGTINATGLFINGSPVSAGGTPGGSPTNVQFNNTTFGGDPTFTFNSTTKVVGANLFNVPNGGSYQQGAFPLILATGNANNTVVGAGPITVTLGGIGAGANLPAHDYLTTAFGYNALNAANATSSEGTESTAFGFNACGDMSGTGPYYNTCVGINAMGTATNGNAVYSNVALGTDSMRDVQALFESTAIGQASMFWYEGQDSTAIGVNSMKGNSALTQTSYQDNCIGAYCLFGASATTEHDNNALGNDTLFTITTGVENVAIGTQSGSSVTTDSRLVLVGFQSGYRLNGSGDNTAVGFRTLFQATTAIENTVIGGNAGFALTTGSNNELFGYDAGQNLTTATGTILIGDAAGGALTNEVGDMFVGHLSGHLATTGGSNTGVGYFALVALTTASNDTAFGASAGASLTTGGSNVLVGTAAGAALTTDINDTFLGTQSGQSANGGSQNTGLGYRTLFSMTTGSLNTAAGSNAGFAITTATNDTLFGANAGTALTTGTFNVLVGDAAGAALTTEGGYTLIGHFAGHLAAGGQGIAGVGDFVFLALTTGSYDTAVGQGSGVALTTGSQNSLFGYDAGNAIVADANDTFLGYQAGFVASNSAAFGDDTGTGYRVFFALTTGVQNTGTGSGSGLGVTTGSNNTLLGYKAGGGITTGNYNLILGSNVANTTLSTGSDNILLGVTQSNGDSCDTAAAGTSNTFAVCGNNATPIISATATNSTPAWTMQGTLTLPGLPTSCTGIVGSKQIAAVAGVLTQC